MKYVPIQVLARKSVDTSGAAARHLLECPCILFEQQLILQIHDSLYIENQRREDSTRRPMSKIREQESI